MWESLSSAWQAYCAGTVPIGAVVTDASGQILSRGRNRIFEMQGEDSYLYGQTLAHAEINALITLDVGRAERHGCILYTTVEPCPLCMGAFFICPACGNCVILLATHWEAAQTCLVQHHT